MVKSVKFDMRAVLNVGGRSVKFLKVGGYGWGFV